jgi:hypothetical protein
MIWLQVRLKSVWIATPICSQQLDFPSGTSACAGSTWTEDPGIAGDESMSFCQLLVVCLCNVLYNRRNMSFFPFIEGI